MYTPFDINESIAHRKDYVEERLRSGSPIVGLRYEGGLLLLLTVRRSQRKVFEIYDRQMFSAIGKQSDYRERAPSFDPEHAPGGVSSAAPTT